MLIKSTPGEAEVYLNDEPKGTTSSKGEIRLPDLAPGTYDLRVSLSGYRSFEQNMTVEAGEAQTVYVTLVPTSPATTPKDTPAAPQPTQTITNPSRGLPVPGAKISPVLFFEGPRDSTVEKKERVYRNNFDHTSTRSIYWEIDLTYPHPQQRIDFQIDAYWYKSDGSQFFSQTLPAYVLPAWPSSWHSLNFGWVDPEHWLPGAYRVDFYCQNTRIASGSFQID
jgi:hypothetical protein